MWAPRHMLSSSPIRRSVLRTSHGAVCSIDGARFSSSSSSPPRSPLLSSFSDRLTHMQQALQRCVDRIETLDKYERLGVFQSSPLEFFENRFLFYSLNRPQTTEIDVLEFLEGAKVAHEVTMLQMYSTEYTKYIMGELDEPCEIAQHLKHCIEPTSLDALAHVVKGNAERGLRIEIKSIETHSAHLVGAYFEQHQTVKPSSSSKSMEERMRLHVRFDTTQKVTVQLPGDDKREENVVQKNSCIWAFESAVTRPEDLEWVLEPMDLAV